jgi:hypothetical protein
MKISPKQVAVEDLLLDPNNPRLARSFQADDDFNPDNPVQCQPAIERLFNVPPEPGSEERANERLQSADSTDEEESENDFFSIKKLVDSIRRVGFVGIQNIIVREDPTSGKYIVVEGNRRLAAIRSVIRDHERAASPEDSAFINDDEILRGLKTLQVMVFDTEGRSEPEVRKEIDTMLGLRHFGSQLKWELLPRAKNIYDEYMRTSQNGEFAWSVKRGTEVADTLAIDKNEVKKLLTGYLCYEQLAKLFEVKPHHFSLILAGAQTSGLTQSGHEYLEIDKRTFELSDSTLENFDRLCEFAYRDRPDFEKILDDPKQFSKLGRIKRASIEGEHETVRAIALRLFNEVVEREKPLEDAWTELVTTKKQANWIQELKKLLDKQEQDQQNGGELTVKNFLGEGSQLQYLEDLKKQLKKLKALVEL